MSVTSTAAVACEPLWHLIYRYWFWGWLFRDVNAGDLLRRAAAWRHNVQQRAHLPVYMRRWCGALIVTGALAMAIETLAGARVAAAAFYTLAVLCSVDPGVRRHRLGVPALARRGLSQWPAGARSA